MIDLHLAVAVNAGELSPAWTRERSLRAVNLIGPSAKHNTPETATRSDTPSELPSTVMSWGYRAAICADTPKKVVCAQVIPNDST
jgi:hypothetical protein